MLASYPGLLTSDFVTYTLQYGDGSSEMCHIWSHTWMSLDTRWIPRKVSEIHFLTHACSQGCQCSSYANEGDHLLNAQA